MAKQTGSEYREKNRIRLQRFYERQAASGKKRISALIPDGIHGHMMDEKDRTGMSISEIIESALNQRYGGQDVTQSRESTAVPFPETSSAETQAPADTGQGLSDQAVKALDDLVESIDRDQEPAPQGDDLIPDCTGREITIDERDKILLQVFEKYPGRKNSQVRVDILNQKKIPVYVESKQYPYGGEWTKKKVTDTLKWAKNRLGIK